MPVILSMGSSISSLPIVSLAAFFPNAQGSRTAAQASIFTLYFPSPSGPGLSDEALPCLPPPAHKEALLHSIVKKPDSKVP